MASISYPELLALIAGLQAQAQRFPLPEWPAGVNICTATQGSGSVA